MRSLSIRVRAARLGAEVGLGIERVSESARASSLSVGLGVGVLALADDASVLIVLDESFLANTLTLTVLLSVNVVASGSALLGIAVEAGTTRADTVSDDVSGGGGVGAGGVEARV